MKRDSKRDNRKNQEFVMPWFPFSVLVFYLAMVFLWNVNIIPHPKELLIIVEGFVEKIGFGGVFIATFIEGLAYIGHQFPGSSIILISLIVSSNSIGSLLLIVLIISVALTASSLVNYFAGTIFSSRIKHKQTKHVRKTLFLSALHPAFLSLYFFHRGINKDGLKEVLLVPLIIFPYGFLVAYLVSLSSDFLREKILSEEIFFLLIFVGWFLLEVLQKNKNG
ncbi:MAG TPA: hypothetical protein VJH92_05920 [Candidatus Nanoarchaeia archaeon]|nr:hypothetical protein [Candidatus Nanoarchaeia archaeon]